MEKLSPIDTSSDAEVVQLRLIRDLSPACRLEKAMALSCEVMRLCKAAIRRRHPEFSEEQVGLKFIELHYGPDLANRVAAWRSGVGD